MKIKGRADLSYLWDVDTGQVVKVAEAISPFGKTPLANSMHNKEASESPEERFRKSVEKAEYASTPEGAYKVYGDKGGKYLGIAGLLYGISKGRSLKGALAKGIWHGAAGMMIGRELAGRTMQAKRKLMPPTEAEKRELVVSALKGDI